MALAPGGGGATRTLPVVLLVFGEIPSTAWLLGRHLGERWRSRAEAVQYPMPVGPPAAVCSTLIPASTFLVPRSRRRPLVN